LEVKQVEVKHWKRSVVHVLTLHTASNGEPVKVCALFDIGDFHPGDSEAARSGHCAENPIFNGAHLLIAEANQWGERKTGHISAERLSELIAAWSPAQTRIVHASGAEDMLDPNSPADYWRRAEAGEMIHPSAGPVPRGVLTAAMQARLAGLGYAQPLTVAAGFPGEVIVVNPTLAPEERIVAVDRDDAGALRVAGFVSRKDAHRFAIRHTTTLILPIVPATDPGSEGRFALQVRIRDGVQTLNIVGGHVSADGKLIHPDCTHRPGVLAEHIRKSAARETNEEVRLDPPRFFTPADFEQLGEVGEFTWEHGAAGKTNIEASTAFTVRLDLATSRMTACDPGGDRITLPEMVFYSLDELLARYRSEPAAFADGLARILKLIVEDAGRGRNIENELRTRLRG
jgi:hypothetical protein